MWETLQQTESVQSAYEKLLLTYEVEPELLHQDLYALIEKLVENGLVEVTEG